MAHPIVLILNSRKEEVKPVPEIQSMPCKIEYTGPANVGSYLLREKQDEGNEKSTFRGRFLDGRLMRLLPNYKLYALKERNAKASKRVYDVEHSTDRFILWEYDRIPTDSNPLPRALNLLKIAEDLANDD